MNSMHSNPDIAPPSFGGILVCEQKFPVIQCFDLPPHWICRHELRWKNGGAISGFHSMYEGRCESNAAYCFLRNYNYNYNEIYICHGYILYKVWIIFPQSLLHYQQTFFTFAWDTVCRSRETLCWRVAALHARCVSARLRPQNGVLGVHPSWGHKDRRQRLLNRDCREDEGEKVQDVNLAGKVIASVFWSSEGILLL